MSCVHALGRRTELTLACYGRQSDHFRSERNTAAELGQKTADVSVAVRKAYYGDAHVIPRLCIRSGSARARVTDKLPPSGLTSPFEGTLPVLEDCEAGLVDAVAVAGLSALPLDPSQLLPLMRGMARNSAALLHVSRWRTGDQVQEVQTYSIEYLSLCVDAVFGCLDRVVIREAKNGDIEGAMCSIAGIMATLRGFM